MPAIALTTARAGHAQAPDGGDVELLNPGFGFRVWDFWDPKTVNSKHQASLEARVLVSLFRAVSLFQAW